MISNRHSLQNQFLDKLRLIKTDDSNHFNLTKIYRDCLDLISKNYQLPDQKAKLESLIETLNTCGHLEQLRLIYRLNNLKLQIENFLSPFAIIIDDIKATISVYVKAAKLSDLIFNIKLNLSNKSQSLVAGDQIRIFNSDKVYVDIDLDDESYSGVNISFIGFDFLLAPEKTRFSIKTDGLKGKTHSNPQAAKGDDAKSLSINAEKCGIDGKPGQDGLNGLPGSHAGNIFIYANNLPYPSQVFFSASGGDGSDGQIGGTNKK